MTKLILITGVSSGLGLAMAKEALAAGHRVVGTVRSNEQRDAFERLAPGRAFARRLDVTDLQAIDPTIASIEHEIAPIDVVVNNAGYGYEGLVEESPLQELRRQFEVNLFGAIAVVKAVLPFMRQRRAGRILNITSIGGLLAFPGLAYYHGSKFALEGISESLAQEVRGFGIFVTAVEPGAFRTDWAGRSMARQPRSIADYDSFFDPMREARETKENGGQRGDPHAAGRAMLALIDHPDPPMHLLLGADAVQWARAHYERRLAEIEAWASLSASTDFK
ncbi:oxidoreductase [Variovorax sp. LjRoot290]|uniref:oxidoreductase n=1 Tax=Variovorax sp. LjRoot290 TaxID=3342316 RepID=UPI003F51335B